MKDRSADAPTREAFVNPVAKKTLEAIYFAFLALGFYLLYFQAYPHGKFIWQAAVCLGVCFVIWCIIVYDSRRSNKKPIT